MKFNSLLPEFYVTDFEKSLRFYRDIVGFLVAYTRDNPRFAFLSHGTSQIMIQELRVGEQVQEKMEYPFGRGLKFQIEVESVQSILDSLKQNNYPLKRSIKDSWYQGNNTSYGCREILVQDPDVYVLRFSEDLGQK